ncbi:acyl-CoA dehydrogenase family protein, partial [Gordonia terrae]
MSIQSAERVEVVSLTDSVRPHLDDVRARARATENARQQTPETIELIKELGLVRALVPKAYGGLEHDVYDWLQALRLLSTADMSAGWVAGLASAHSFVITKFDKRVQEEIWGELGPDAIVSSATALFDDGIAQPVDGGYTVSGRWRFASGITAADWIMALIQVPVGNTGDHAPYWALIPKSDFTIDDTWRVSGMRGSGSHDFTVDNIFIPNHRLGGPGLAVEPADGPLYDNPLFNLPFLVIFPIIFAPVAVGGAEAAVELFRTQLTTRKA